MTLPLVPLLSLQIDKKLLDGYSSRSLSENCYYSMQHWNFGLLFPLFICFQAICDVFILIFAWSDWVMLAFNAIFIYQSRIAQSVVF